MLGIIAVGFTTKAKPGDKRAELEAAWLDNLAEYLCIVLQKHNAGGERAYTCSYSGVTCIMLLAQDIDAAANLITESLAFLRLLESAQVMSVDATNPDNPVYRMHHLSGDHAP